VQDTNALVDFKEKDDKAHAESRNCCGYRNQISISPKLQDATKSQIKYHLEGAKINPFFSNNNSGTVTNGPLNLKSFLR
jgi:hypothetical protein